MATYNEIYDTWQTESLKKQIVISVLKAAQDVFAEAGTVTNHTNRLAWAKVVLVDPHLMALKMSAGVILNTTIQSGTYTDNDVQTVVTGLVNVFANNL